MGGRRLAVRILGVAATIHGFAYSLTEGPGCLVDVSIRRKRRKLSDVVKALSAVLARSRPLFVAIGDTTRKRGAREHALNKALVAACDLQGVMILRITARQLGALVGSEEINKWEIARKVARQFPEIAHRLPSKANLWEAEDDRIGLFMSTAVALAAWQMFGQPQIQIDDSQSHNHAKQS